MSQCYALNAGRRRDFHDVGVGAVSPCFFGRVFLGRVLRVMDHEIGVRHEVRVPAVTLVQDRLNAASLGTSAPQLIGERLMVY